MKDGIFLWRLGKQTQEIKGQKPVRKVEWNGVGSLWMLRTLLQEKQKLIGEERGRAKQEKQLCPYLVKGSEGVVRGPDAWVSK